MASQRLIGYWSESQAPKTGLTTAVVSAWRLSDGVQVLTNQALTEVAGGFYQYLWTSYDIDEPYVYLYDAGAAASVDSRYLPATNDSFLADHEEGIPPAVRTELATELARIDVAISTRSDFNNAVDEVITDAASRLASKADVSNLDVAVSTRSTFDNTSDEVITDAASRTASQADVSALALEATLQSVLKLAEADAVFDEANGLLHLYERGTTTDLVPAKSVVGTQVGQNVEIQE